LIRPFAPSPLGWWLFTALFIAWAAFELLYVNLALERRWRGGQGHAADRLSRLLIFAAMGLAFTLAWTATAWRAADLAPASLGWRGALFYSGLALMAGGLAFRYWAIRTLGRYFAPDVSLEREHKLVETGLYRYLRHPSYTGTMLTILGYGLALTNWAALAIMLVVPGLAYGYRMRVEEQALQVAFGEAYRAYARRTRRIIPFLF
jgi:protein-S-isoprenylcysteine O-methyltransferase Ste14